MTMRLLQRISNDADEISNEGERSGEQAAMALDSLFIALYRARRKGSRTHPTFRAAINGLFQQLENPSSYNPALILRGKCARWVRC